MFNIFPSPQLRFIKKLLKKTSQNKLTWTYRQIQIKDVSSYIYECRVNSSLVEVSKTYFREIKAVKCYLQMDGVAIEHVNNKFIEKLWNAAASSLEVKTITKLMNQ